MKTGSLSITFNPSEIHKDWLLRKFFSIEKYYTTTTYTMEGQFKISQSVHYDLVPVYLLEKLKKKLEMSDFQFEMYIYDP